MFSLYWLKWRLIDHVLSYLETGGKQKLLQSFVKHGIIVGAYVASVDKGNVNKYQRIQSRDSFKPDFLKESLEEVIPVRSYTTKPQFTCADVNNAKRIGSFRDFLSDRYSVFVSVFNIDQQIVIESMHFRCLTPF